MMVFWLIAALYIPQTNQDTLGESALNKGEVAYVDEGNEMATLRIGNDTTRPMFVVDPGGLRGFEIEQAGRDEFIIVGDNGMVYQASDDRLYTENVTTGQVFHITISSRRKDAIYKVSYKARGQVGVTNGTIVSSDVVEYDGNVVRIACTITVGANPVWFAVSEVKVYYRKVGFENYTNDLNKVDFKLKDDLGTFLFSGLRKWAKNLYNGNRGEDWSKYGAVSSVDVGYHNLVLGSSGQVVFSAASTNEELVSFGPTKVFSVIGSTGDDTPAVGNILRITGIEYEEGEVQITFTQTIANFDINKLAVEKCAPGDSVWLPVNYTASSGNTVLTVAAPSSEMLYRLSYNEGSIISGAAELRIHAPLVIKGDDGIYYRIHINGGTITATAVQ